MSFPFLSAEENHALAQMARLHDMTEEAILRRGLYRYNYEVFGVSLEHLFPKVLPVSTPITLDELGRCKNDGCPFWQLCAQHHSVGDFRAESGLRPMLVKINNKNEVSCCTHDNQLRNLGIGSIHKDDVTVTEIGCIVYSHPRRINGLHET